MADFSMTPIAPRPKRPEPGSEREPLALHARAEADLAFVRATMERTSLFTAVPGVAGAIMGATALVAAIVAALQPTRDRWLAVWVAEAALALVIGGAGIVHKARRFGVPLDVGPARRFALGLAPPILGGAALSVGAVRSDSWELLPAIWMCCYGIGVLGAGAVSTVSLVPLLGAAFLLFGMASVASPASWGDVYLALTFGLGHLAAGILIARRHGG